VAGRIDAGTNSHASLPSTCCGSQSRAPGQCADTPFAAAIHLSPSFPPSAALRTKIGNPAPPALPFTAPNPRQPDDAQLAGPRPPDVPAGSVGRASCLPRSFYNRDTIVVARELLGKHLVPAKH